VVFIYYNTKVESSKAKDHVIDKAYRIGKKNPYSKIQNKRLLEKVSKFRWVNIYEYVFKTESVAFRR